MVERKRLDKNGNTKEAGHGKGGGRPPHVVTDKSKTIVHTMASLGFTQEDIAFKLKISVDTLVKYYPEEIESGRIDANMQIAGKLYQKAKQGDTTCMLFWLKTRARWKENHDNEDKNVNVTIHGGLPE